MQTFADISSGDIAGAVMGIVMLMIPITYILSKHQYRMAELMRRDHQGQGLAPVVDPRVGELVNQMSELKQLVLQQAIALDNVSNELARMREGSEAIESRLRSQV